VLWLTRFSLSAVSVDDVARRGPGGERRQGASGDCRVYAKRPLRGHRERAARIGARHVGAAEVARERRILPRDRCGELDRSAVAVFEKIALAVAAPLRRFGVAVERAVNEREWLPSASITYSCVRLVAEPLVVEPE
jgi:hypothetical protein